MTNDPAKDIVPLLSQLGFVVSPRWLALGALIVILGGGVLYLFTKLREMRANKKKEAPPPLSEGEAPARGPGPIAPGQLRAAWLRFLASLPAAYRRSILNFEHFVVVGTAASGKSRLIDAATDWRRQTKQFLESRPLDPDLQVFLGSGVVVTEVPARILFDHTPRCQRALERLWRPLYARRTPTVVVVVDAPRLAEMTEEDVVDFADRVRGKTNLLTAIRGKAPEVRVVLTHLDELPGHAAWSALCRDQGIPLRVRVECEEGAPPAGKQLDAWLESARGQLPRALVHASSADFRAVVAFLRALPAVLPPVARFVDALFAHDALSRDPRCGGVFLAAEPVGQPNPLAHAEEFGPGPDPRLPHAIAAVAAAVAVVGFLSMSYREQRAQYDAAVRALSEYDAAAAGTEKEVARRLAMRSFAWSSAGGVLAYPDWFARARTLLRAEFSKRVRDQLLVPRLKLVAERGAVATDAQRFPLRRSLYYIALIHDSRTDDLNVLSNLDIWTKMTELDADVVRDYLRATDDRFVGAVPFELSAAEEDQRDSATFWASFLDEVTGFVSTGYIRKADLASLQTRASSLSASLDRFEHDNVTRGILARLGEVTEWKYSRDPAVAKMREAYEAKFGGFLANVVASDVLGQRRVMLDVLTALRANKMEVPESRLASELETHLSTLYAAPTETASATKLTVQVAGREYQFEPRRWAEVVRDGSAFEQIVSFLRLRSEEKTIFAAADDGDIAPVVWNAANDGTSLFLGRATIEPRYTRAGFDRYVREVVLRLAATLERVKVPDDQKHALADFVRDQVKVYALEYRAQLGRFYRVYRVRASRQEELRVVLAQMNAPVSPFTDFVAAVDKQISVDAEFPLLAPMSEALSDFATFHQSVSSAKGAPPIDVYREMIRQLLSDVGGAGASGATEPIVAAPPAADATLEKTLSRTGQLALRAVNGAKGSYPQMVREWVSSVHLPDWQQAPFVGPVELMMTIGLQDLSAEVGRAWDREVMQDLGRLTDKYPFNGKSADDITTRELESFFNPQRGRFFDVFRRWFEPVTEVADGKPFQELPALRGKITYPPRMFATINAVAGLAGYLWDGQGKPAPIDVKVATVPLERGANASAIPTLNFFTVGDVTVFNFNQKPQVSTIKFDWTRDQSAQVGAQLTDLDTKENKYPAPLAFDTTHWNLFRLLAAAEASVAKQTRDATQLTWSVGTGAEAAKVRFLTFANPADPFVAVHQVVKPATSGGTE